MLSVSDLQNPPLTRQLAGGLKLLLILVLAVVLLSLVGCAEVHAADETPAAEPAPVAPVPEPAAEAEAVNDEIVPALQPVRRRQANNLDIIFGVQGSFQDTIDVPTATEKWKIGGGGSSWLGYRRDVGDGLFSFGGKMGLRGIGITQENSTTGLDFHHTLQSFFVMPNARISVPLGSHKALWFVDLGLGVGFHQFVLDDDVPNGTPKPRVDPSVAFDLMSGFLFCVYNGDSRLDIGFNIDIVAAEGDIKKVYPSGTPAADKFKKFNLGHTGLNFNLAVKF